jgi:hypothetical protein
MAAYRDCASANTMEKAMQSIGCSVERKIENCGLRYNPYDDNGPPRPDFAALAAEKDEALGR